MRAESNNYLNRQRDRLEKLHYINKLKKIYQDDRFDSPYRADSNANSYLFWRADTGEFMKTYYDQLGVTPQASFTAIQQSFFRLARKLDPKLPENEGNEAIREQYLAVQTAYRALSDAERRYSYDRDLLLHTAAHRSARHQLVTGPMLTSTNV